jgi:Kdo2-lipid IVA lauroyltransferase/acyltransferase
MKYRIKHVLEYALLRGVVGFFGLLPYRVALALGWCLALVSWWPAHKRTQAAVARVAEVFGAKFTPRERQRIVWQAWRNLFFNVIEIMRIPRLTPARIARMSVVHDEGGVAEHIRSGRGAIIAVPHIGNWDLAGIAAQSYGVPILFMARRQKNPLTDAYLNRMRSSTGVETIMNDTSAIRLALRRLGAGKVLAMLPDVRARRQSLEIAFLGGHANLGRGMAVFAREAGIPVFPCCVWREGWTRHHFQSLAPIWPQPGVEAEVEDRRITQQVMTQLDAVIRAHPEQYFWFNKRWVLEPLSAG